MNQKEQDRATLTAIMERFNNWRYPRAISILERLQTGEKATEVDLQFLDRVAESAREVMPIIKRNPEYHEFATKAINVLLEINELAQKNEGLEGSKKPEGQ